MVEYLEYPEYKESWGCEIGTESPEFRYLKKIIVLGCRLTRLFFPGETL